MRKNFRFMIVDLRSNVNDLCFGQRAEDHEERAFSLYPFCFSLDS
jgi:hypothetical protein